MSARNTRRSLSFQSLENRLQFAADVSLQFVNGDLTITGDGDAETVVIEEVRVNGLFPREVMTVKGQEGTTINGQASVTLFANAVRNININLNGGNDQLSLEGVDSDVNGGDLNIRLGNGDDELLMFRVNFSGDVLIQAEGNDDVVSAAEIHAGNLMQIDLGNGDDICVLADSTAEDVKFIGGFGDDQIGLFNVDATDDLFAQLDDGDDELLMQKCNADKFVLDGGDDDDTFTIDFNVTGLGQPNDDVKALGGLANFEHVNID